MLVILDRDGVINEESHHYIKSVTEWIPIPGSLQAIARLKKAGHFVVVATNQSGIARGLFTKDTLSQIHQKLIDELAKWQVTLDGIYYCPHHPEDECQCRKPRPGLFHQAAKELGMQINGALCVGDSLRDIKAALEVGATPILVLTGNGTTTLAQLNGLDVPVYNDLEEAVDAILGSDLTR